MHLVSQKLLLIVLLLSPVFFASGQEKFPSPEIGQMYQSVLSDMSRGNYSNAISTCRQAILIAPSVTGFQQQLGMALYCSGSIAQSAAVFELLTEKPNPDTLCYRWLGAARRQMHDFGKAKTAISKGLQLFPHAGALYHELGLTYLEEKHTKKALDAWIDGIEKDPQYPYNYFDAARYCLLASNVTWGLIYAESYLAMSHDPGSDSLMKSMLLDGYKKMSEYIANSGKPVRNTSAIADDFETSVIRTFTQLTPVVSDGITTENLVMLRARMAMDWKSEYSSRFPFALFDYFSMLLANGRFEIYSEWLFGEVENKDQFKAWTDFHPGDIERLVAWKETHPLTPGGETYNSRHFDGIKAHSRK